VRAIITLVIIFSTVLTWAQTTDNLLQKEEHQIDSIQSGIQYQSDSLKKVYKQKLSVIDSVNTSFHTKTDSVQHALQGKLSNLNSVGSGLEHKIDSLKSLNLPTEKYTHKLDSVNQVREKTIADANKKIQSLKAQTTDKLKTVQLPPELQSKVGNVTKNIDGFKLPTQEMNLSSVDNSLSKIGDVNLSSKSLGEVGKLPEMNGMGNELKDLQGNMKDVTKVTGEVGAYQKDIQSVTSGNLNEVKALPKTLETKAADISGIGGLQGETKALDQYKDQLGKVQNPDAMKKEAVQQVQQAAIDHFAGKEQVLQQAMDKMAKYKKKYSSLQSLSEVGKRRPNEMHGKPLVERLLPGFGFQVLRKKSDVQVDLNPFIGYRLSGRLTSGIGWNHRITYNDKHNRLQTGGHSRAFGPRMYSEFNLFKGFFPRFELEAINTLVPTPGSPYTAYEQKREWVWSAFMGMKKNYRFLKHVNGYTAIMVNLYNPLHKSPYGDIVNMRIGFEFPMKKK